MEQNPTSTPFQRAGRQEPLGKQSESSWQSCTPWFAQSFAHVASVPPAGSGTEHAPSARVAPSRQHGSPEQSALWAQLMTTPWQLGANVVMQTARVALSTQHSGAPGPPSTPHVPPEPQGISPGESGAASPASHEELASCAPLGPPSLDGALSLLSMLSEGVSWAKLESTAGMFVSSWLAQAPSASASSPASLT